MPEPLAHALGLGDVPSLVDALATAARVAPLAMLAPWVAWRGVPPLPRLAIGVVLTLALLPVGLHEARPMAPNELLLLAGRELVVGLCLAVTTSIPLFAFEHAGRMIDAHRGATRAGAPESSSPLGTLHALLGAALFLALGGHRVVIDALARSYEIAPLLGASGDASLWLGAARIVTASLTLAVSLAAPALVALVLLEIALGLVERAAPHLSAQLVAAPLRAVAGLAVVLLALSVGVDALAPRFGEAIGAARALLAR